MGSMDAHHVGSDDGVGSGSRSRARATSMSGLERAYAADAADDDPAPISLLLVQEIPLVSKVKLSAQISRRSSLVSAPPWRRKARWTGGRCRRSSAAPPPRVAASKPREPRPRIRNPGACSPRPTRHPHPHRGTRPSPCWKIAGTAPRTTSGAQLCLGPATPHPHHPWRRPRGSTLARAWRSGNARVRYSCAHR